MLNLCAWFLAQFDITCPQASRLLFPGLLVGPGQFTPQAQGLITGIVEACAGPVQQRFISCIRSIRTACAAVPMEENENAQST